MLKLNQILIYIKNQNTIMNYAETVNVNQIIPARMATCTKLQANIIDAGLYLVSEYTSDACSVISSLNRVNYGMSVSLKTIYKAKKLILDYEFLIIGCDKKNEITNKNLLNRAIEAINDVIDKSENNNDTNI